MKEFSLEGFVADLARMTVDMSLAEDAALSRAAKVIQAEAKSEIGHYQDQAGQFAEWAELKEMTKIERAAAGYAEDEPLLRTGEMRDSIEITVMPREAHIGSDSDVAVYQELGTFEGARIPPRSFLGGAAFRKAPEVAREIGTDLVATLVGDEVVGKALPIMKALP